MLKGCGNPGTETENMTINIVKHWHQTLEIIRSDHRRILVLNIRDVWHQTEENTGTEYLENTGIEKDKN
jgi:hypothetical protein